MRRNSYNQRNGLARLGSTAQFWVQSNAGVLLFGLDFVGTNHLACGTQFRMEIRLLSSALYRIQYTSGIRPAQKAESP